MMNKKLLAHSVALGLMSITVLSGCSKDATQTSSAQVESAGTVQHIEHGVIVTPTQGQAKAVRLQVMADNIIRVTAIPHSKLNAVADSLIVNMPAAGQFTTARSNNLLQLRTREMTAEVSLINGTVTVKNAAGEILLSEENSGEFSTVTQETITPDFDSYAINQQWNRGSDEGFFGLGQHQNGQINYAGESVRLLTHNLSIAIPYVISTRNYGVLWDNASITNFGDPQPATGLGQELILYDANGNPGGLTANYYDGDTLVFSRVESDPDYKFLSNNSVREKPMPQEVSHVKQPRVVWTGSIEAKATGLHRFRMYNSGYATLSIGGKELLNRWRMNWNPWYHNTEIELEKGKKVAINIDWDSQDGFFRLAHSDPQPKDDRFSLSFTSETGKAKDYYVVVGENKDALISGYRTLTGKSVMLPKWAYGFWQSRERYKTQDELLNVLKEYRARQLPIDNIVLDWSYWPSDAWGSHDFDPQYFPDPIKMTQTVHDLNATIMISIWPKFYPTTDNYKELDAKGYMLTNNVLKEKNLDWIAPGYLNGFYDPYPVESQQIFWRQLNEKLNVKGFDAWWLDASEPDIHSNLSYQKRKENMNELSVGSGAEFFNSYALPNAEGVYKGERKTDGHKRSFILTRSGFAGIQRTGSAIWSGDIVPRWSNLKEQIAAGVGVSLAGVPNWTMDIGGFTPEDHYRTGPNGFVGHYSEMAKEYQAQWQEMQTRWFQFGAFVPLFRSHGQNPYREIFNIADEDSEAYASMVYYLKLRYRLMPYIYSIAGDIYHKDGTMMRGLVMDFPEDKIAINLNDAYMFGKALLINPVYEYEARTRDVYLPAGTDWYDFYSGEKYTGGQTIKADAPLVKMPLYVKAGAIIPTGENIQYVYDKPTGAYTINVFTGADGSFEIYEDDGKTYDYESGKYSYIPLTYDESLQTLTIGERRGTFEGVLENRTYHIRWISEGIVPDNFDAKPATTITYSGKTVSLTRTP
ncbi:glycoside hydrolase family 31 protein [Alteromonas lipotrueae]|uniref:glycoside hydrolase family 31 protein n=1 Tax=Alteromonas lipotrueae TaxID=2803814 RepID=UPI00215CDA23|nr:TIM-barrel domain-containing protein [Alteromonas lipotrueae]